MPSRNFLIGLLVLSVFIVQSSLPLVNAVVISGNLPSNTIWADDFESATTGAGDSKAVTNAGAWINNDNCSGWSVAQSNDRSFTGAQSLKVVNPNNPTACDVDARHALTYTHDSIVGFQVSFAFSDSMRFTVAGQSVYLSLECWDNVNSLRYEARLDYKPNSRFWSYAHDSQVSTQIGAIDIISAYNDTTSSRRTQENWITVKVEANCNTYQWVSITTDQTVYSCSALPLGCNMNRIADSSISGTGSNNIWGEEIAISGGRVTPTNAFTAYFDNVIVTDESRVSCGATCLILKGIPLLSTFFPLMIVLAGTGSVSSIYGTVFNLRSKKRLLEYNRFLFLIPAACMISIVCLVMIAVLASVLAPST